jgi:outer membrane protein W
MLSCRRILWPTVAFCLALSSLTAQAQDDDSGGVPGEAYQWAVQLRGLYVAPLNEHRPLDINASGGVQGELAGEWFFMPRWSTELSIGSPANLNLQNAPGSIRLLNQTWTVKYYFPNVAVGGLIPYVGTGIYHSTSTGVDAGPGVSFGNSGVGWVLQGGFNYNLPNNVFFSADVRYLDNLEPTLIVGGGNSGHIGLDPFVFGIGVGMRF